MQQNLILLFIALLPLWSSAQSTAANIEVIKGDEAANSFNYSTALEHYTRFLELSPKLGLYRNPSREADVQRKLAYIHSMLGKYQLALESFRKAAATDSALNDKYNMLADVNGQAKTLLYLGNYQEGLKILKHLLPEAELLQSSRKKENKLLAADIFTSLAEAQGLLGLFRESNKNLHQALAIYNRQNHKTGISYALLRLGSNEFELGNYEQAAELIHQALARAKQIGLSTAEHFIILGKIAALEGNYENALRYDRLALFQADSVDNRAHKILINITIGDLYLEIGDAASARMYYSVAADMAELNKLEKSDAKAIIATRSGDYHTGLNFFKKAGAEINKSVTLLRITQSFFKRQEYDSALFYANKTTQTLSTEHNTEKVALAGFYRAASLIELQQTAQCAQILDSALEATTNPENKWKLLYYYGRLHEHNGNTPMAKQYYTQAIELIETLRGNLQNDELKAAFMDLRIAVYDHLIALLVHSGNTEESFNWAEKARNRVFLDMMAKQKSLAVADKDTTLANTELQLRYKLVSLREKLIALNTSNTDSAQAIKLQLENELTWAINEYDDFLNRLKQQNSKLIELLRPEIINTQTLAQKLDTNSVVLEYWVASSEIYIWAVTKDSISLAKVDFDEDQQDWLFRSLSLFSTRSSQTNTFLAKLYQLLIAPVANRLSRGNNILVAPHGILHFVPFQALMQNNNRFLVDDYVLSYIPSASILLQTAKAKPGNNQSLMAMALGNLRIENLSPLASTITEVNEITAMYTHAVSRVEKECTANFFKKNASQFDILHLATHGVFNEHNPLASYLVFNNDSSGNYKLKVSDIFGLKLESELVTLSACQTGLGSVSNSDEIVGLSRAFLYAGSSSIIVSLWNIDDKSSAKLMVLFYNYLKTHNARNALTMAQRDLRNEGFAVRDWAAFVLLGGL